MCGLNQQNDVIAEVDMIAVFIDNRFVSWLTDYRKAAKL